MWARDIDFAFFYDFSIGFWTVWYNVFLFHFNINIK